MKNKYGKIKKIKRITDESAKIKTLYECIQKQVYYLEKVIPEEKRFTTLLLLIEMAIRAREEQTKDPYKNRPNIIEGLNYNFLEKIQETCFDTLSFSKFTDDLFISFDESIRTITFALKHSLHKKTSTIYPLEKVEIDYLNSYVKHLVYSVAWDIAEDVESWWMIDAIDISGGKNTTTVKVKDHIASKRLIISNKRNLSGKRVLSNNFYKEAEKIESHSYNRRYLPPHSFWDKEEFIAAKFCAGYFSDSTLTDVYHGIKLAEWIRVYSIIRKINTNFLKNNEPCRLSLSEFCHIQEKSWWINTFREHGLSQESAINIIPYLTFNSKSNDLLDAPFISDGDSIICLPTIASYIGAGHSIFSNLKSKNHISQRGDRFEEYIRKLFKHYGIASHKIKSCDAVVEIDDVLFIFECKAYAGQYGVRDHNILFNHLLTDSVAFNKNVNGLLENLELVRKAFKKPKDWQPESIYKAFIIMGKIGQAEQFNGCYIIDETLLTSFLKRATFNLPNENLEECEQHFWEYEGNVTAEKFIKLITMPRPIEIYEAECDLQDLKMQFYSMKINYQCYLKSTPGFYIPFEREFLEL